MRIYSLLLVILIFLSCKQGVKDIKQLNGYWEIEKAVLKTGKSKDYTTNTIIDYFQLGEDLTGTRKKVKPLLDGTFETVTDDELIKLSQDGNIWSIHYQTDFSKWTERLESLDDNHLVLINEDDKTYIYKRYTPEQRP